jgi:hypothetical protein
VPERFPATEVVAIDIDPLLLDLAPRRVRRRSTGSNWRQLADVSRARRAHGKPEQGYLPGSGKEDFMTEHPAENHTDLDEPRVEDLIDETRGPEEDPPADVPLTPEPPD